MGFSEVYPPNPLSTPYQPPPNPLSTPYEPPMKYNVIMKKKTGKPVLKEQRDIRKRSLYKI